MTEKQMLELLWDHYHCQIDENRAVHRSLEELREDIKELKDELATRTNRSHQHSELV